MQLNTKSLDSLVHKHLSGSTTLWITPEQAGRFKDLGVIADSSLSFGQHA